MASPVDAPAAPRSSTSFVAGFTRGLSHLAAAASSAASTASSAASSAAKSAAAGAGAGAKALQKHLASDALVGSEVCVAGRRFVVEQLLAQGGFGNVYCVTNPPEAPPPGAAASSLGGALAVPAGGGASAAASAGAGAGAGAGVGPVAAPPQKRVLKKMFAPSPELARQLMAEVRLMEQLSSCPGIVRVECSEAVKVSTKEGAGLEILVIMELCPGGHLLTRLNGLRESKRVLPWTKILEVFVQIVRPVAFMHAMQPPVTHRDLKFENVLVAQDGTLRLCDFGSASTHMGPVRDKADRNEQEDAILRYTTPHFRSPEMCDLFNGQPLDCRSDVWALGCMLYGLAYYAHPFQDAGNLAILSSRYKLPTSPPFPAPIHTMIRACLQYRPEDRPSSAQIAAYVEECLRIGAAHPAGAGAGAGAFPSLPLSGGGSAPAIALSPPAPGSEGSLPDGSVMVSGVRGEGSNSAETWGSGAGAGSGGSSATGHDPAAHSASSGGAAAGGGGDAPHAILRAVQPAFHMPTAQDILQHVQSQALASAAASASTGTRSSALQNRLKGRGGAAPLATLASALHASALAHPSAPAPVHAPHVAQVPSVSASADFDAGFVSFGGPSSAAAVEPVGSGARRPSGVDSAPSDSFSFDDFGSELPTALSASATATTRRARAPSGEAASAAPAAPAADSALDNFFDAAPSAEGEDPFLALELPRRPAAAVVPPPSAALSLDEFFS